MGLIDRSLTLNPSFARGWMLSGILRNFAGQPDLAIEHFKTSLAAKPARSHRKPWHWSGYCSFLQSPVRRRGSESCSRRCKHAPTFLVTYRFLASCYAHMGRLDEAREIVRRLREITPVVMPSVIPYRNPEQRELFLSGLRLAAGEAP